MCLKEVVHMINMEGLSERAKMEDIVSFIVNSWPKCNLCGLLRLQQGGGKSNRGNLMLYSNASINQNM